MAHATTGALTAGAHPAFPQTASWSMVDIAKLPVQGTVGILSRYAAGRVNPYTVLVCQELCRLFHLTAHGRANVDAAVNSLNAVGALGSALEFGFGVEDLIRSMTKSEQGTAVLALCAALREGYSLDIATEVLFEMARLCEMGEEWMPSSRELQALLNACSGTLSTTTFGTRSEVYMQLWPDDLRLGAFQRAEAQPSKMRHCSTPNSIARALLEISAISRGKLQAVTLIGGPDIGWLAAVTEWILGLKISIFDSEGVPLFTNADYSEPTQVNFIFSQNEPQKNQEIALQGRTYVLQQLSELMDYDAAVLTGSAVSGRIEWKKALASAFLSDFKDLLSVPDTFGTLLGCAARMYKAIAQADTSIPSIYLTACTTYCDSSYGPGFVVNTLFWFPELERLRQHMENAVKLSLKDARRDYESSIIRLRQKCGCQACQSPLNGFNLEGDVEMTPAPEIDFEEQGQRVQTEIGEESSHLSSESEIDWDADKYCAVILAETIISLSRILATVSLDDSRLLPMRSGFELAYGRQLMMRRSARSGFRAIKELGQFAFCMDFDANFFFGMRSNDYGTGLRIDLALELFSGERTIFSGDGVSAACSNGLCAYFAALKNVSLTRSSTGFIRLIPGRIQYEKKSYIVLEDRNVVEDVQIDETISNLISTGTDYQKMEISIKESSTALKCLLQLPHTSSKVHKVVCGPANLVDLIAARRGLIQCDRTSGRGRKCRRLKELSVEERSRLSTEGGLLKKEWLMGEGAHFINCKEHLTARAILAHCANQYLHRASIFIVDEECTDCCLRVASGIQREDTLYFICLPGNLNLTEADTVSASLPRGR